MTTEARLFALMDHVVPQAERLTPLKADLELTQLGFDSMALISLFIELEAEFELPVQAMRHGLHRRCTVGGLLSMCEAHAAIGPDSAGFSA